MREFLQGEMAKGANSAIRDFTFITFPLGRLDQIYETRLSNLANFPDYSFVTLFLS